MSNESDSDEYVDAQDATPIRIHRNSEKRHSTEPVSPLSLATPNLEDEEARLEKQRLLMEKKRKEEEEKRKQEDELLQQKVRDLEQRKKELQEKKDAEKRARELENRKKKLERKRYLLEEEEYISMLPNSETSSVNSNEVFNNPRQDFSDKDSVASVESISSVEGLAAIMDRLEGKTTPSKENSRSQESLGTVPIIDVCDTSAAGDYPGISNNMPEPDIVASTKGKPPDIELPAPVAPPRRKRKGKPSLASTTPPTTPVIPSPATTVENLTRELEESLDLKSAASGERVVKPQDLEPNKAEGPPPSELLEGEECKGPDINPMMRTRSNSGRLLSDQEILESIMVLNLDTGEQIPLSLAEDRLPKCINPLSLHIMRLTSEYVSNSSLNKRRDSDGEDGGQKSNPSQDSHNSNMKKKGMRFKRLIGKTVEKTVNKIKHVADEVLHGEDSSSSDDELSTEARRTIKIKASSSHKGPYVFDQLRLVQDIKGEHTGAVWTMKFSHCGRLLASAGQDNQLRIWVLKDAYSYFDDMRQKYQTEVKVSPAPSQESLGSHHSAEEPADPGVSADPEASEDSKAPFISKPFCVYSGHTADLLDVSWSKNYFILSSSMDKTVRLWHISRKECLCCFQHIDFVTAIAFHPRDDRYFLSGSLDGKLRLWNIPDKKVALWNEVDSQTKLITAANFCQNGKFAVVGTYDGRCIFYNTEQLKYYTQIHCRSSRGKNAKGRKISGIEPMPGEDKVLVTSNDSRIRLYDLRDLSLTSKYRGCSNSSSQIKASFSHDGKYIVCGSEDRYVYIWKTYHDYSKFSSARRDRNDFWESIKAHNALVTAAIFAPNPSLIFKQIEKEKISVDDGETKSLKSKEAKAIGEVLVTADFSGAIKVFINKPKSKLISSQSAASMASTASSTS